MNRNLAIARRALTVLWILRQLVYFCLFLIISAGDIAAQGWEIYGVSTNGGMAGVIFKTDGNGDNFQILKNFDYSNPGKDFVGDMTQSPGGLLYGISQSGSDGYSGGVLFSYDTLSKVYRVLHCFEQSQGSKPMSAPVRASGDVLYGTCSWGGPIPAGFLYKYVIPSDTMVVLYDFNSIIGEEPRGKLHIASNGKIYGIARSGGTFGNGTIFEFNPSNQTVNKVYDFNSSGGLGAASDGGLIHWSGTKLYGVSSKGIYCFDLATYSVSLVLNSANLGYGYFLSYLLKGNDNCIYFSAEDGATKRVLKYNPSNQTVNVVYTGTLKFLNTIKQCSDGYFYGCTSTGLQRLHPDTGQFESLVYTVVRKGGVTILDNNVIYFFGDDDSKLKRYLLNTKTCSNQISMNLLLFGANPIGGLAADYDGIHLVGQLRTGTTIYNNNPGGGVYQFDPATGEVSNIYNYGGYGYGPTAFATLYGSDLLPYHYFIKSSSWMCNKNPVLKYRNSAMNSYCFSTNNGRMSNPLISDGWTNGYGCMIDDANLSIFYIYHFNSLTNAITIKDTISDPLNGKLPLSKLTMDGNLLYGVCREGGAYGMGVIFSFNLSTNVYTKLYDFTVANGGYTTTALVKSGNCLYGTTPTGGTYNKGTFFRFDLLSSTYTVLFSFDGTDHGSMPTGDLCFTGGDFYGLTRSGGIYNYGVMYNMSTTGVCTKKHDFNKTDGYNPEDCNLFRFMEPTYSYRDKSIIACDYFILPGSQDTVTTSGLYRDTVVSPTGWNVIYRYSIQIGHDAESFQNISACESYLAPDNSVHTTSESFEVHLPTSLGCDSTIHINLQINHSSDTLINITVMDSYIDPYGHLLNTSGTYTYNLTNSMGCDSTIVLSLTVVNYHESRIWASCISAGSDYGTIISVNHSGDDFQLHYTFPGNTGVTPANFRFVRAPNGKLYTALSDGGPYGEGSIIELDPDSNTVKVVHGFAGNQTCAPISDFLFSEGKFIGLTRSIGKIYSFDPDSHEYIVLHAFSSPYIRPEGRLCKGSDGLYYGVTSQDGANYKGIVFSFDPLTNTCLEKISFSAADGPPSNSLVQAETDKFYGISSTGGVSNKGVIYEYNASSNVLEVKAVFDGTNGSYPYCALVRHPNGKFYGTTSDGGSHSGGVLFEYEMNSPTVTVLYHFKSGTGYKPYSGLVVGEDQKLYGTTGSGGVGNQGVLFQYDLLTSCYTVLHYFEATSGGSPNGTLYEKEGSVLYGITGAGGNYSKGVIFSYSISDHLYTPIYHLGACPDGANPIPGLVRAFDNRMYGLVSNGGAYFKGAIYKLDPYTDSVRIVYSFSPEDSLGNNFQGLMQASNGVLYGTTTGGGKNNCGTLYSFKPGTNAVEKLYDFNNNAKGPMGEMVQGSNGWLYIITSTSSSGFGAVVRFNIMTHQFEMVKTFTGQPNPGNTYCGLMKYTDGFLYGLTYNGGASNKGALFKIDETGNLFTLYSFNTSSGYTPTSRLVHFNNKLYGFTRDGGSYSDGTLFEYDPISQTVTRNKSLSYRLTGALSVSPGGLILGFSYITGIYSSGNVVVYDPSSDVLTMKQSLGKENGRVGTSLEHFNDMPDCLSYSDTLEISACDSYQSPDGLTYTSSGFYISIIQGSSKCDSIIPFYLSVGEQDTTVSLVVEACGSYLAPDQTTISSSGVYHYTIPRLFGCDSIITLNLTVFPEDSSVINYSGCAPFIAPDGSSHYQSGTYTAVFENQNHCDSSFVCNINILDTYSEIDTLACNSYTAPDGSIYDTSGTYNSVIPNQAGCDSVITIDLIIKESTASSITVTSCDSYMAPDGAVYTASGIYNSVIPNQAGCDSVITIDVTIKEGTASSITATSCDSYVAPDGAVYTASGTYNSVVPNQAGCDSIITIDLTIRESTASSIIATSCDSFTAPDGTVYSSSGTYNSVIPNQIGCDSVITIDLTIKESTMSSVTTTSCDSYTAPDGTIYTSSGTYNSVIPNMAGCDSLVTIDLTIKESTMSSIAATSCDSYTAPDGAIYTSSGIYNSVIPNMAGCDSVITIDLFINESTMSSITPTSCDSYTAPDGSIFTASGIYNSVIPNQAGCDSVITIDLTVKESTMSSFSANSCNSYTAPDGTVYTVGGLITSVIPNAQGCDSTISIDLTVETINPSIEINGNLLTALPSGASYNWLYCDTNFTVIPGQTNQTYEASETGYYAVVVNSGLCTDTTSCYYILITSTPGEYGTMQVFLFPNPAHSAFWVNSVNKKVRSIRVYSIAGDLIEERKVNDFKNLVQINCVAGIYTVEVVTEDGSISYFKLMLMP